jgi:hypothetical protein
LLAESSRISPPGPGALLVTIGSKSASKNSGSMRASMPARSSPSASGKAAPFSSADSAAAAKSAGSSRSRNLRAVRLL